MTALTDLQRVDFDHVFRVTDAGEIVDGPTGVYAPEVWHDEDRDVDGFDRATWEPLTGYTGQHSYRGAVMHSSEYLGGRIASDILGTPGIYVVTAVEVLPDDEDPEPEPAGWAVLRMREVTA